MRITFDPAADAAMIYLADSIPRGGVNRSEVCDIEIREGAVILDFDAEDHLIGIEVLDASKLLAPQVLGEALNSDDGYDKAE